MKHPANKKNVIFFHNIMSPYRLDLFEYMSAFKCEINFKFYFMRESRRGRYWQIDKNKINFNYLLGRGIYFQILNYDFHFNPLLIFKIIKSKEDVVLCGSWNNFNNIILILLKRLKIIENKLHTWSELNFTSVKSNLYFISKFRKFYYNTIDGLYLVPGKMSILSFGKLNIDIDSDKLVYFPNLVSNKKFSINSFDLDKKLKSNEIKAIFPARLIEKRKGIINFLKYSKIENLRRIKIIIAGTGPDEKMIKNFINLNKLSENILLEGQLSTSELIKYYKECHFIILPSFIDPSPLSLVEAISFKLPLIASKNCGNHYETLVHKKNGFLVDVNDPKSISESLDFMIQNCKSINLINESERLYRLNFNNKSIVSNLVNSLLK